MALKKILDEMEDHMKKSVRNVHDEFSSIRTGKASPSLVENIMVEYYGSQLKLREIAGITTPDPRLIVVQPWDVGAVSAIEKAIMKSDLGITPNNDGRILRIPIPELNEERRKDLIKLVKKMSEDGKVSIRNIRRHANHEIEREFKEATVTEDEKFEAVEKTQKKTDEHIKEIDELVKHKEKEIMEV
ncbi:MAG: ribosome recycling factor [Candidatus Aureabacteria bacterium]|nr:ribosome recycling factor [Candidatus Auribacterota bacterium]